jgi:hypothetical protein
MDRRARKVSTVASHRLSQVLDKIVADALLEIAGFHVFVKVNDLLV